MRRATNRIKDGIAKLVEVPAHVVEAFTHLKAEDRSACEKYLALIFIKLYRAKKIDLAHIEIYAPFIASELRRQGRLERGDA